MPYSNLERCQLWQLYLRLSDIVSADNIVKISTLSSGTFSQTLNLEKFCYRTSSVASVVTLFYFILLTDDKCDDCGYFVTLSVTFVQHTTDSSRGFVSDS